MSSGWCWSMRRARSPLSQNAGSPGAGESSNRLARSSVGDSYAQSDARRSAPPRRPLARDREPFAPRLPRGSSRCLATISSPSRSHRCHAITIDRPARRLAVAVSDGRRQSRGLVRYDVLDNGRQRSEERIVPELQHLTLGMVFPALPGVTDCSRSWRSNRGATSYSAGVRTTPS